MGAGKKDKDESLLTKAFVNDLGRRSGNFPADQTTLRSRSIAIFVYVATFVLLRSITPVTLRLHSYYYRLPAKQEGITVEDKHGDLGVVY